MTSSAPRERHLRLGALPFVYGALSALSTFLGFLIQPILLGLSIGLVVRASRYDTAVEGRGLIAALGWVGIFRSIAIATLVTLTAVIVLDPFFGQGSSFAPTGWTERARFLWEDARTVASSKGLELPLYASLVLVVSARLVEIVMLIGLWFRISLRTRRVFWAVIDSLLLIAFVFATWTLPFAPPAEATDDPTLFMITVAICSLVAVRIFARCLPIALDAIERTGVQTMIGARMLRARKSAFLSMIGVLSISAVSFSSCALCTTLSVMGGFRQDLQQKIIGMNAHVLVDRQYGSFEGWAPTLERVRAVPGVIGASPYVSGDVMLTSASNLSGAQLRGIDPEAIRTISNLESTLTRGRLEYLADPESLLHLPPEEMTGSILDTARNRRPERREPRERMNSAAPDAGIARTEQPDYDPTPEADSFLREIDRALGEFDEEHLLGQDAFGSPELELSRLAALERPRQAMPGLIVGQELARSLRLHVGDEVNVVSPLGDLGPSGPIPRSRPFRVAGIFYSGYFEFDMKVVYTELGAAQRFLSLGDAVHGIEVKVDDWERASERSDAVRAALSRSDLRVRSWQEVNQNLFGALAIEKLAMFLTLGIAILVASFCIVGTLVLMVQEKRKEIGILKAMGARDRQVIGVFVLQGMLIGLIGAVTGLGLGWLVCFVIRFLPLDPEIYYIDRLPIHTASGDFVAVGIAAVLVSVTATIYPALLGSRMRPVDALRGT